MDGIGASLTRATMKTLDATPLLVATASDFALYPNLGADPEVLPFRLWTRGFRELAAISHLGPAVASLVTMGRIYGDGA